MSSQYDDQSIEEEIHRAIRKVKPSLEAIPLESSTPFASLGLASLERAIVVFELEDLYEVSIVDANLDAFRTVAEAREPSQSLLSQKSAPLTPLVRQA